MRDFPRSKGGIIGREGARLTPAPRLPVYRIVFAQAEYLGLGLIDPALLPAFETAFLQRLHLRFRYRDAIGAETIREVEPHALLILTPLWYLVACEVDICPFSEMPR